jgi:hypothetical protein
MNTFDIIIKQTQIKSVLNISLEKVNKFIIEFEDAKGNKQKKFKSGKEGIKIFAISKLLSFRYSNLKKEKFDLTNKVLAYINNNNANLKNLKKLTSLLNQFMHKYISFFCGRCEGIGHHKGLINQYLKPITQYKPDMLNNFFSDTEHGFFHGMMASFICFVINEDGKLVEKTSSLEKIFMSATLHDFLKANGVEQKEHDRQLKKVFPKLCEETYVHSDPPSKYHKKHLIIADRLELRRYPDYAEWVDERFHKLYEKMHSSTREMLNLFYDNVRPALEYAFKYKSQPFLRHGTEVAQSQIEEFFPPTNTTYVKIKGDDRLFPVEIDMPPFSSVNEESQLKETNHWHKDNQQGHCSNHDGLSQWNIIKGYIAMSEFKKTGIVVDTHTRDHLYAKSKTPCKDWFFVYQNLDKILDLKTTTQDKRFLDSRAGVDPFKYLDRLLMKKHSVVSQETLFLMFQFVRMFTCRIVVLQ